MRMLLLWLANAFTRHKLQVRDLDESVIPAVCYDDCELAYNEAQKDGKTAALCATSGEFHGYYDECITCIDENTSNTTASLAYISDKFSPYIDYCDAATAPEPVATTGSLSTESVSETQVGVSSATGQEATKTITDVSIEWITPNSPTTTIPASYLSVYETAATSVLGLTQLSGGVVTSTLSTNFNVTSTLAGYFIHLSIDSLISDYIPPGVLSEIAVSVSSAAAVASITGNPTSLLYSALEGSSRPVWFASAVPATYAAQMSTLEAEIDSLKRTATGSAGGSPSTGPSSHAWIAGAVIGPLAGVGFVLLGLILLQRRRRLQRQRQVEVIVEEDKENKAQLHGDSLPIPNPVFEMDAMQESYPHELATVERAQELCHGGHHQPDEGVIHDHDSSLPHGGFAS